MIDKSLDERIEKILDEERLYIAKKGFFVVKSDRSGVFCPEGRLLRKKSVKRGGFVRYCTKSACPQCLFPCFPMSEKKRFKEIDFSAKTFIKGDGERLKEILDELGY